MYLRSLTAAVCVLAVGFSGGVVQADYLLSGGEGSGTFRIRDNGDLVGYYYPSPEDQGLEESFGEDYAATPDLQTVYQFTNSLGFSRTVFAYDVLSREYQPAKNLHTFGFPPPNEDFILNARSALIRPSDPLGTGDLFVISGWFFAPLPEIHPQIKRFDRETDSYVESIDSPTSGGILDFTFGPDNRLYMAAEEGVFIYEESATGFNLVSATPLIGSLTGAIAFGPDGNLYVRRIDTGNVERYTSAGVFVDIFIPAASIPGSSTVNYYGFPLSIQFGVDGNMHVLANSTLIGKYAGATGSLLSLTDFHDNPSFSFALGRVTYLPVPEPSSILLACLSGGYLAALCRGRRNQRR